MLLQMGVSIVILRLLTPEQMGIMAIPVVFSSLALVMVDSGFSQTLIRKAVPSEEDYKSVFVFNIAVSVLLYLLLVGAMPWIARFYGMPELVRIAGVVPACASQCPVRDSEYDFHPAVPFRPAFEGRFYFVARKRTGGYRYGLGRMRYLEPGGATGSGDGCTGHVAVGVERLAPSGGFRRGPWLRIASGCWRPI